MKDNYMSMSEATIAASNLRSIENRLGRPVPPGLLDVTDYSKEYLSISEIERIVKNIESVEFAKKYSNPAIELKVTLIVLAAYILYTLIVCAFR